MPGRLRSFDEDAKAASDTALPIPRGIAFEYPPPPGAPDPLAAATTAVEPTLPGWKIEAVKELPGWFEALAPRQSAGAAGSRPIPLDDFWERLRRLRGVGGVAQAEPLLLTAVPQPTGEVERDAFAMGVGQEQFGLWGLPYDDELASEIRQAAASPLWHLDKLRVRDADRDADGDAWALWRDRFPGELPGRGIVVGHPDTGYSDHREVKDCFANGGKSFMRDANGRTAPDARDPLDVGFLQNPGHGTATASVIASGEHDALPAATEAYGVAPGAKILPLRVSRSVIHFDLDAVGRAILYAKDHADVVSMSLGSPSYSKFVRRCVQAAMEEGVIVIAAAGNQIPATVFPAALPEVIGVAATHAANAPWRFSGIGRLVDIAAPGEDIWHARAGVPASSGGDTVVQGTGTSFATACVAGLAALWLSYHGGRQQIADDHYRGQKGLVPFAFQSLLARSANATYPFVQEGKYGAGLADARKLLEEALPSEAEAARFRDVIRAQPVNYLTFISGLFSGGMGVTDRTAVTLTREATVDAAGQLRTSLVADTNAVKRAAAEHAAEQALLQRILDDQVDALSEELMARVAADRLLLVGFQRWRQGESLLPLLDRLLTSPQTHGGVMAPANTLSVALQDQLSQARAAEERRLKQVHRGELVPGVTVTVPQEANGDAKALGLGLQAPACRQLRAYAFDPSLETKLETAPIHQVTIPARWEEPLAPGPVGEYLEVIDVDPSSGCVYSPVDLNHPYVLGQDGLSPSEGNPQFHQQMVYAVAMNTINRFELALGRPIFWAPLRPWLADRADERYYYTPESLELLKVTRQDEELPRTVERRDRYVQRLRVYPHALREANAYYSPQKRALLFGYFPGAADDTGRHYPGGLVFTCLSHDIIAHETTHALLDGMHPYFNEPSNEDVWAFHEAFADIMALFQHFTYPEVLRHQIANTRGNLQTDNLLAQMAQQFGQTTGGRGALRDALGGVDEKTQRWERRKADPRALRGARQPHARGSILVAAIFDAFLALYNDRVADLLRLATGGTGVLQAGQIHPDLVNRLASEAAATADEVLRVCIRAMDYVPPVDVTFGEFLRALITADYDLSPTERRRNRIAFIDAFRSWGIYPRDVPTLSEDSLRWRGPDPGALLTNLTEVAGFADRYQKTLERLVPVLESWQPVGTPSGAGHHGGQAPIPGNQRGVVFQHIADAQAQLYTLFRGMQSNAPDQRPLLPGLDLRAGARFSVGNLRPARRLGLQGEFRTEMVVEIVQTYRPLEDAGPAGNGAGAGPGPFPFRGGATLIVDLRTWDVRYPIYKRLYEELPEQPGRGGRPVERFYRQAQFAARRGQGIAAETPGTWPGETTGKLGAWLAATYAGENGEAPRRWHGAASEPFALLHRDFE